MPPKDNRQQRLDSWLALMEEGPLPEGPICLPVLSGSMVPEIPVNSLAHIEKAEASHCRIGQVVVYRDKDRLVIHRVLLRLGWRSSILFYEKGDSNVLGGWIKGSQVRGTVVAVDHQNEESPQPCLINTPKARSSFGADFKHRILVVPRRIKRLILG